MVEPLKVTEVAGVTIVFHLLLSTAGAVVIVLDSTTCQAATPEPAVSVAVKVVTGNVSDVAVDGKVKAVIIGATISTFSVTLAVLLAETLPAASFAQA
jgi:hypothetical protein